jgi:lipopolysaccharide biosynthesis glycosyltransferase
MRLQSVPDDIQIAFISDAAYGHYLPVAMFSIMESLSCPGNVHFHIIDCGISRVDEDSINHLAHQFSNCIVTSTRIDGARLKKYPVRGHFSHALYAKLLLAELMPAISKVIYLDVDLLVMADISELWREKMNHAPVLAVSNPRYRFDPILSVPPDVNLLNSGVMVANLTQWRREDLQAKAFELLDRYGSRLQYCDQDIFNLILMGRWGVLSPKWNVQNCFFYQSETRSVYSEREIAQAVRNPAIVHYSSNSKPWQFRNGHPYRKYFLASYRRTYGRDLICADEGLTALLQKMKETWIMSRQHRLIKKLDQPSR